LKAYEIEPENMWRHSLAVAFGSKILAKKIDSELIDDAFVAGLLHDAGKIILDPYIFERKKEFGKLVKDGRQGFLKAELVLLGFDHAEIMSRATRFWRFPEEQSTAIRYHHYPSLSEDVALAYIIHLADYVAKTAGFQVNGSLAELEQGALQFLGVREEEIDPIKTAVTDSVNMLEEEFL
jgi:HD-like signal output (HDOD) protein